MTKPEATFTDLATALEAGTHFLSTSHINPDGDALGSSLAVAELLDGMGKQVTVYNANGVPHSYAYLPTAGRIVHTLPKQFDTAIFLECPDAERIGDRLEDVVRIAGTTINIDHHASNSRYATLNYIDSTAAALGELIHPFFGHFQVEVTYAAAVALWTSLMTDTGSFRYDNTRAHTLRLAAELLEFGFDPAAIYDSVYERRSAAGTKLLGRAMSEFQLAGDGRVAWVTVPRQWFEELRGAPEDLSDLAEMLRGITGVEVSCVMREDTRGKVKVSMRSRSTADVHAVAQRHGGGGHTKAAGCTIAKPLETVRDTLLPELIAALPPRP